MPDLEISKPDFGVKNGEREDVVDERFSSPSLWRHAEYLCFLCSNIQQLMRNFHDHDGNGKDRERAARNTHMREQLFRQSSPLGLLKRRIEAQDPTTALETIPSHFELVHRVHILHVQLDARPIWRLGRPEVEVLMPTRLKVQRIVT